MTLFHDLEHSRYAFGFLCGEVFGFREIFPKVVELGLSLFIEIILQEFPIALAQCAARALFVKFPVEEIVC